MKKILLFFILLFVNCIGFLVLVPKNALAACPSAISINPDTVDPDFGKDIGNNTNVVISTSADCFSTPVTYVIRACPSGTFNISKCSVDRKTPQDRKTINAKINLFQSAIGKENPGTWKIVVCQNNSNSASEQCDANILGSANLSVGALPTPTLTPIPSNLIKIFTIPNDCRFQTGTPIKITVTNMQPRQQYCWWWDQDIFTISCFSSESDVGTFDIKANETLKSGSRIACADIQGLRRCFKGSQNSIELFFTPEPPTGSTVCTQNDLGSKKPEEIPITPTGPPPPCLEGTKENGEKTNNASEIVKCTKVDTAIGGINTDPAGFIKTLFVVLLSLSGGFAVFTITVAGYQLMISGSNPETATEAREKITSAIVGILFIILSVAILQIIGVDIFQIPGLFPKP